MLITAYTSLKEYKNHFYGGLISLMKKIEFYQFSGEEFQHLRKKMRFNQKEMALMLNISPPMINLIERDKRVLSPDAAISFVDIVKKYLRYDISLSLDAFLRVQLRELKR